MDIFRRILFRVLHDERTIYKLSESRPIRYLARVCASIFIQGKSITEDPALKNAHPKVIKEVFSGLSKETVKTVKDGLEEIKKAIKK